MMRKPGVMNSPPVEYSELCFIRCGRSGVQLTDFPPSRPQMQIQHRQLFSECVELKSNPEKAVPKTYKVDENRQL